MLSVENELNNCHRMEKSLLKRVKGLELYGKFRWCFWNCPFQKQCM